MPVCSSAQTPVCLVCTRDPRIRSDEMTFVADFKKPADLDVTICRELLSELSTAVPEIEACVHYWPKLDEWLQFRCYLPLAKRDEICVILRSHGAHSAIGVICSYLADFLLQEGVCHPDRCQDITHLPL